VIAEFMLALKGNNKSPEVIAGDTGDISGHFLSGSCLFGCQLTG